jgi:hypothetical protein
MCDPSACRSPNLSAAPAFVVASKIAKLIWRSHLRQLSRPPIKGQHPGPTPNILDIPVSAVQRNSSKIGYDSLSMEPTLENGLNKIHRCLMLIAEVRVRPAN